MLGLMMVIIVYSSFLLAITLYVLSMVYCISGENKTSYCIPKHWVCDEYDDCGNNFEEENC